MPSRYEVLELEGREVRVSNPGKVFFPALGLTKMDLISYYLDVAEGVLTGVRARPMTLYRWPNGVAAPADAFFQKRAPKPRPDFVETALITFPSGRSAELVVVAGRAALGWVLNLGCIDLNPWPVRCADVDHPDELRIDLDPTPGVPFGDVRAVAMVVRVVLEEHALVGFPKTSGQRGLHIYVRIEPRWSFTDVRRAALALARGVERRAPELATTAWWKEERRGVFVDYNQNARDRTIASAYSVRPTPEGRVSCPLSWDEVPSVEPGELTITTVPRRYATHGDPGAAIDDVAHDLTPLLELAGRDETGGLGDAPWPPHFPKAGREPPRVPPSRRRRA